TQAINDPRHLRLSNRRLIQSGNYPVSIKVFILDVSPAIVYSRRTKLGGRVARFLIVHKKPLCNITLRYAYIVSNIRTPRRADSSIVGLFINCEFIVTVGESTPAGHPKVTAEIMVDIQGGIYPFGGHFAHIGF